MLPSRGKSPQHARTRECCRLFSRNIPPEAVICNQDGDYPRLRFKLFVLRSMYHEIDTSAAKTNPWLLGEHGFRYEVLIGSQTFITSRKGGGGISYKKYLVWVLNVEQTFNLSQPGSGNICRLVFFTSSTERVASRQPNTSVTISSALLPTAAVSTVSTVLFPAAVFFSDVTTRAWNEGIP